MGSRCDAEAARCKRIVLAEGFETFLDNRFKGHKRFSLEGGEPTIAIIEELLDRAAAARRARGASSAWRIADA